MKYFFLLLIILPSLTWAKKTISEKQKIDILKNQFTKQGDKQHTDRLRAMSLHLGSKAVPTLIQVMKEAKYPEQNRWQATFLLGKIMGRKASPFIAKFVDHPLWIMRVASLKALSALREKQYDDLYVKALKDPSLIVRIQALDNISQLKLTNLSPVVWSMLYDQSNYVGEAGRRKRTSIVGNIIRTIGDLKYEKAKKPLLAILKKQKYEDLNDDIDYSLSQMTGRIADGKDLNEKRNYWLKNLY